MISSRQKAANKAKYNKHNHKTLVGLSIIPKNEKGKTDRSLMDNFLKPFKQDLLNNGIKDPHCFTEIFKKHKIYRPQLQILIKDIEKYLQVKEVITSKRELNHSNTFEKNILLTYQALHDPYGMYYVLYNYISANHPEIANRNQLFSDLEIEIRKVHTQSKNSLFQTQNSQEQKGSSPSQCSSVCSLENASQQPIPTEIISEHEDELDFFTDSCGSFDETYDDFCNQNLEDDLIL